MRIMWLANGSSYAGHGVALGANNERLTEADLVIALANPNGVLKIRVGSGNSTHTTYLLVRNLCWISVQEQETT